MPNTNCLEGFKCPKCGYDKEFRIEVSTVLTFTDAGSNDEGADNEWQDDSYCECTVCDHAGKVSDFRREE